MDRGGGVKKRFTGYFPMGVRKERETRKRKGGEALKKEHMRKKRKKLAI